MLTQQKIGFDAAVEFSPNSIPTTQITNQKNFYNKNYNGLLYDYNSAIDFSINKYVEKDYIKFRGICPNWDNEARKPGQEQHLSMLVLMDIKDG